MNAQNFLHTVGGPHAGDCALKGFVVGSLDCVGYRRTIQDIQVPLKMKARGKVTGTSPPTQAHACFELVDRSARAQGAPHSAPLGALQGAPLGPCGKLTDLEDGLRHQLEERL